MSRASKLLDEAQLTNLADVRKELKKMGFKLGTKTLSWGKHAKFKDMSGDELPSIFFAGDPQTDHWKPLVDWRNKNREALLKIGKENGITALAPSGK